MGTDAGAGQALSANTMRQAMNPMDQYDVFAQLVAEGMKTTKVAKLFDLPPKRVNQVLALASLAPSIKDQVRKGDLSWETAQALTLIKRPEGAGPGAGAARRSSLGHQERRA